VKIRTSTHFRALRSSISAGRVLRLLLLVSLTLVYQAPQKLPAEEFRQALPGKSYAFPRDHFSHPEFKTEWWYYSGHLQSTGPNSKSYGYQLTFFRTGLNRQAKEQKSKWSIHDLYFAHLAVTDDSNKNFQYREKIHRGSLGQAGADEKVLRVWIEDWVLGGNGPAARQHLLKAGDKDLGIDFTLTPERPPIIHGLHGISQKGQGEGHASHYYSITRLATSGKLFLKGREVPVNGMTWMDHEFGSAQLQEDQVGWDWFSMQLENGIDAMVYMIRRKDGRSDPHSSGTVLLPDGHSQHLSLSEFGVEVLETWKSQKSQATYPSMWRLRIPGQRLDLTIVPTVKDQELVTNQSTRVTYWEGSVKIEGTHEGRRIGGKGYVELTGYAGSLSKRM
jgi:predicted secreted hydrolase